jgi:hypothetical protein
MLAPYLCTSLEAAALSRALCRAWPSQLLKAPAYPWCSQRAAAARTLASRSCTASRAESSMGTCAATGLPGSRACNLKHTCCVHVYDAFHGCC